MIQVKRLNGEVLITLDAMPEGALVHRELMGEHYAKFPFDLAEPVYLRLGDYVELDNFGHFELIFPYAPKFDPATGAYKYTLQLEAYYMKWKNKKCRYIPTASASETSFHLTAAVDVHLDVIVNGINAVGDLDSNFRYQQTQSFRYELRNFPADKVGVAKYMQYQNIDFITALNNLADIFECEWWVEVNTIYFGKCLLDGEEVDFEQDANVEEMSSSESSNEYATRIVAFGSTRNLPPDYRKDTTADLIRNGVVEKRLMLPLVKCPNGYVQDATIYNETEAVEAIVIDEDVYPRTQCVVSRVETYTKAVEDDDGEVITRTFYRLYDKSGFNFNTDMILEGETLHILFQSGSMNRMDFECEYNNTKKYYEVVANEDYGRFLPDTELHPKVDDTFVLLNWDSSKIGDTGLIDKAEEELYQNACKALDDMKIDPNTYDCAMRSDWYSERMDKDSFTVYNLGQRVKLINPTYFKDGRSSRIIGYEIKLDIPYDTPEYTVGEAAAYSRYKDLQGQIDSLTFNGVSYSNNGRSSSSGVYIITTTSTTPSSDYNVYSAARSDRQFLRRDRADTAYGQITHKQEVIQENGAQFGEHFVGGLVGVGGRVDGRGYAEFRGLRLWEWLEVPEYRFNKVLVNVGLRMLAAGGGIIETVMPDSTGAETGSCTLKLEDGDIGAIEEGDFCMGIWHDYDGGNETTSTDDKRGIFTFAGFKTVYFQVASIPAVDADGNDNSDRHYFTYLLRGEAEGGNGIHPFEAMHFSQRGNPDFEERQALFYETTQYSVWLCDIKTWEFQPSNYFEIRGNLEGFTMPAVDWDGNQYTKVFHGHGQVFGNAYIFGQIDTFERLAYRMFIEQSLGGMLGPGETEDVSCTILNGYGADVTDQFTHYSVTRNSGDSASDAIWNAKHTNVGNPLQISFDDLGIDGIRKIYVLFNIIATDEATSNTVMAQPNYFS